MICLTIAGMLISCSKNNSSGVPPPVINVTASTVYACGDTGSYANRIAVFWKNNVVQTIGGKYTGSTRAVGVVGSDLYLAVDTITPLGDNQVTSIWKNGTRQLLGTGTVYSMFYCRAGCLFSW